jgi:hypothetical protein
MNGSPQAHLQLRTCVRPLLQRAWTRRIDGSSTQPQDPQLNDKGEAGVFPRAQRNAFVLDAAQELLSRSRVGYLHACVLACRAACAFTKPPWLQTASSSRIDRCPQP